ncbi:MAG: hypothetical protein KJ737_03910 [Proteobacteria bacterium]|nr:hypothetical protein [Pseudomonadota bacterium]
MEKIRMNLIGGALSGERHDNLPQRPQRTTEKNRSDTIWSHFSSAVSLKSKERKNR